MAISDFSQPPATSHQPPATSHQPWPWPLLLSTPYEAIAEAGPILLHAPIGSPAYEAWKQGSAIKESVWLESDASVEELHRILQRRLRIFTPEHRELWLRFADARPLYQAWQSNAQWPEGFWHRIARIWLHYEGKTFCAWNNEHPEKDGAPTNRGIAAQLTLDWPLLEALAKQDDTAQDEPPWVSRRLHLLRNWSHDAKAT